VDRIQVKEATPEKRGGVDVLSFMSVTAAVFQLEMFALNLEADWNAVGGCRCGGGHNPEK
jgi:hypothetical protein